VWSDFVWPDFADYARLKLSYVINKI
jgi:hypothetical protein